MNGSCFVWSRYDVTVSMGLEVMMIAINLDYISLEGQGIV